MTLIKRLMRFLAKRLNWPTCEDTVNMPSPVETPRVEPPVTSQPPPRPTLSELCTHMRDFEGQPGDPNWRNNNPLNARFYDPHRTGTDSAYLPKYRPVRRSPAGFAIFKDYSTGWLYGFNMLKHKIEKHPEWTLLDLISDHAPTSDGNDPVNYSRWVAKRLGVDNRFPCRDLVLR